MDRPVGAIIVAVLVFLRGLFALFVGVLALGFGTLALVGGAFTSTSLGIDAGTVSLIWGGLKLLGGVIFLGLGYGLLKGASWAWMWTVIFLGLAIVMDIVPMFTGGGIAWISLLFSGIILVYMLTGGVREAYLE